MAFQISPPTRFLMLLAGCSVLKSIFCSLFSKHLELGFLRLTTAPQPYVRYTLMWHQYFLIWLALYGATVKISSLGFSYSTWQHSFVDSSLLHNQAVILSKSTLPASSHPAVGEVSVHGKDFGKATKLSVVLRSWKLCLYGAVNFGNA